MNQRINPSWVRRFIAVAVMAAIIKSGMLVWSYFLPAEGIDYTAPQTDALSNTLYKPSVAFGLQRSRPSKSIGDSGEPVYRLDTLNLKGIYLDRAIAFILVQNGKEDILIFKGDRFQGYTLVDIFPDKAVFEKNGRLYEVVFSEPEGGAISINGTESVVDNGGFVSVRRKELSYYAKNFDAIWQNIKIQEIMKNNRLTGFKVGWIKKDSVFAKLGLQEGDIITGINGKPVSSVSEVFKIYQNLGKIDNLTIEIKRNNQERQLDYAIYE
jgi:type II secretion system protein C